ncbi:MAG: cytochrome c oxidase subunit 3 [Hyphomicrobium sp.]|jgi:cytochrome c oxidase subunit 3
MSITLLYVAVVISIAAWWLWRHGVTEKPWLEQDAIGNPPAPSTSAVPTSKIGLGVFLAVVAALFALLVSAYSMRMSVGDWVPLPIPKVLWLNTGVLVLSSVALRSAQVAASDGRMDGVKSGVLAGGGTAYAFLCGQLVAWHQLTGEGFFMAANAATAFFYLMTALHGLHVAGGLVALGRVSAKIWGDKIWGEEQVDAQEMHLSVQLCAMYWHFLLLIWLILFALLMGFADDFISICRQVFA